MDKFLEKIMNFINENTMLLIIICIFLIVILVIYLIDNTIKTRRLEQEELERMLQNIDNYDGSGIGQLEVRG